jgi:hypothetical protein
MEAQFIGSIAVITPDTSRTRSLYLDALGLSLETEPDGYLHSEDISGSRSFGVWPLTQAAQACFGTPGTHQESIYPTCDDALTGLLSRTHYGSQAGPIAVIDRASGLGRLESGQARPRRRRVHTVLWAPGGGRVDLDEPGDTPQSRTLPAPVRWKCDPAGLHLGGLERVNFDPHARTTRPPTENALVVHHCPVSPHSQCP